MSHQQAKYSRAFLKLADTSRKALTQRNMRQALQGFRKLVSQSGCPVDILLDAAQALTRSGELCETREVLSQVRQSGPLADGLCLRLASEYFKAGDLQQAEDLLAEAWQRTQSEIYLVPLAEVYERQGRGEEALAFLEGMQSPTPRSRLIAGLILSRNGDVEQALPLLDKARQTGQRTNDQLTPFRAALEAARCHEQLGDFQTAWDTVLDARQRKFPDAGVVQTFDKGYQDKLARGQRDVSDFLTHCPDRLVEPEADAPLLVAGHPRSGTSVVTVALAKALNRVQFDESCAFTQSLEHSLVEKSPVHRLKTKTLDTVREAYFRRLGEIESGVTSATPLIDKNPGHELLALRWLSVFPSSRVVFVQRHPLDTLISCLFTYLPPNPISLQYYTPERAADSILTSREIQNRLCEAMPEHFLTVSYDEFTADGKLPACSLPEPAATVAIEETALNSPNYFQAAKPVYRTATKRYEHYLPFLPDEVVRQMHSLE